MSAVVKYSPETAKGTQTVHKIHRVLKQVQRLGLLHSLTYFAVAGLIWCLSVAWKARLFLHWRLSPQVGDAEYAERQQLCEGCPHVNKWRDRRYCNACGCPVWRWSELSSKNRLRGHNCPHGFHSGSTRDEYLLQRAEESRARKKEDEAAGDCPGCGGNGRANIIKPSGEILSGGNHGNMHMDRRHK